MFVPKNVINSSTNSKNAKKKNERTVYVVERVLGAAIQGMENQWDIVDARAQANLLIILI